MPSRLSDQEFFARTQPRIRWDWCHVDTFLCGAIVGLLIALVFSPAVPR